MATWEQIEKRMKAHIDARFDAIETKQDQLTFLVERLEDRVMGLRHDLSDQENLIGAIDELAEDARRRERQQWLSESRAAMKAS